MSDRKADKSDGVDKNKVRKLSLDEIWPVHSAGGWPQSVSLDRGDIYEGRT